MTGRYLLLVCLLLRAAPAQAPLSEARIRADLAYLTSNRCEGRLSMHGGSEEAARFIAAEFKKAGLKPWFQEFRLAAYSSPGKARLRIQRAGVTREPGFSFDAPPNFPRPVTVKAPLVSAGYGVTAPEYGYDDYTGVDARGKIVLLREGEPPAAAGTLHGGRAMKALNAQKHGALGVLIARQPAPPPAPSGAALGFTMQVLEEGEIRVPVFVVDDSVAADLLAPETAVEIRAGGGLRKRGRSVSVLAMVEGADPALRDQTVLVCAHYDHLGKQKGKLFPGANDNGSGAAALLELARAFGQTRPSRTILFAAFGSEEQGLLGSHHYTAHPPRPLDGTVVINLDMIGRNEEPEVKLVGGRFSPELRRAVREQNAAVGLTILENSHSDEDRAMLISSDHLPFLLHGVPAVMLSSGTHPGVHTPSDTVDRLSFPKLMRIAKLACLTTAALAAAPSVPRFVP